MTRLDFALEQIRLARAYTCRLIDAVEPAAWFRMPAAGVTHIGWEVGHLAMAEYRLALERIRGVAPEDEQLISAAFLDHFGRGSVPEADPARNPSPDEIRAVLDRVHAQAMVELPTLADARLDEPPTSPHPMFTTKFGALTWLAQHEMMHAGQIGLIRRQLGATPLR